MYGLKIYVNGSVIKEFKDMNLEEARKTFFSYNRAWECYPELLVNGVPQTTTRALEHLVLNPTDR